MVYINIYGIVICILASIFIFFFKGLRLAGNKLLFSFFVTFTIKYTIEIINKDIGSVFLSNLSISIGLSKYIFFYLYLKYTTSDKRFIAINDLLNFLPLFLILIYFVIAKYDIVQGMNHPNTHFIIINRIMLLLMIVFLGLSFRLLKKHNEELKKIYSYESAKISLVWVICILSYDAIIHISAGFWSIMSKEGLLERLNVLLIFYRFNETIWLLIIMILGIWQGTIAPTLIDKATDKKFRGNSIKNYTNTLEEYMRKKKPYTMVNLTIENLAEQLGIKKHVLSEIINVHLNTNFFNFIKEYRVNHVIQLMKDEKSKNIKLIYLAFDSGFNSKSAFNRAFKEITGKTPTEYLKSIK